MIIKRTMLLSLALVACHRAPTCETSITNAIEVGKTVPVKPRVPDDEWSRTAKVKEVLIAHCTADGWADQTRACYGDAKDNAGLVDCIDKLTKDQQDKLMKDLAPIMAGSGGSGSAASGPGGSGSAGSGSGGPP